MSFLCVLPMTTRTTMTVTQSVCKICRYRSAGAAIKNDVSKSYVITFEAMHVPKCWEKHLSVSNKTHVKIWPSVLGISDPIMDLEALIVWRSRWSVRDQKEILGKKYLIVEKNKTKRKNILQRKTKWRGKVHSLLLRKKRIEKEKEENRKKISLLVRRRKTILPLEYSFWVQSEKIVPGIQLSIEIHKGTTN